MPPTVAGMAIAVMMVSDTARASLYLSVNTSTWTRALRAPSYPPRCSGQGLDDAAAKGGLQVGHYSARTRNPCIATKLVSLSDIYSAARSLLSEIVAQEYAATWSIGETQARFCSVSVTSIFAILLSPRCLLARPRGRLIDLGAQNIGHIIDNLRAFAIGPPGA